MFGKHSICRDCLGRSPSLHFCSQVESLEIINCKKKNMVCPNSSRDKSFFLKPICWYKGDINGTFGGPGGPGMEVWKHLTAWGYWVNCFQRPLYFHAENPKALGLGVCKRPKKPISEVAYSAGILAIADDSLLLIRISKGEDHGNGAWSMNMMGGLKYEQRHVTSYNINQADKISGWTE